MTPDKCLTCGFPASPTCCHDRREAIERERFLAFAHAQNWSDEEFSRLCAGGSELEKEVLRLHFKEKCPLDEIRRKVDTRARIAYIFERGLNRIRFVLAQHERRMMHDWRCRPNDSLDAVLNSLEIDAKEWAADSQRENIEDGGTLRVGVEILKRLRG